MQGQCTNIAGATLTIDLGAIARNYRRIARTVAPATVGAVVKANAYGLGAVPVARTLAAVGCRDFFVAHLGEAIPLRPELPADSRLFVLNGLPAGAASPCEMAGIIPVLNSPEQIAEWRTLAAQRRRTLPAALQMDSGMSRLGLAPEDMAALAHDPAALAGIDIHLVMSHLACADEADAAANGVQRRAFVATTSWLGGARRSLGNSGAAFLPPAFHFDLVRTGIALYGGAVRSGEPSPMEPVVGLEAAIIQTRTIPDGTGVGYGLRYRAAGARRIATIGVGYADGWPRHLSSRGSAFIGGVRVPIAGRISMDSLSLDITDVPQAAAGPGTPVTLLGPEQSIDDVAADAGTIAYEILTSLGSRYSRRYIPDGITPA